MSRLPDGESWGRIAPILREALGVPPAARAALLERACAGDAALRCEIEALLGADAQAADGSFLGAPAELDPSDPPEGPSGEPIAAGGAEAARAAGRVIGPYRIVREIGRGGMGVVYEAEQQRPRRLVALKLILGGHDDPVAVRMFQRECESLARLRHPSVAAIYESGATDAGEHYFAMELVNGMMLSRHLEAEGPPRTRDEVRRRLALFRKIGAAVAYAHQRGVIHRDLKPSNVLVLPEPADRPSHPSGSGAADSVPDVKILDFGLSRITAEDAGGATAVTAFGRVQGTLPYMSPEQVRGRRDEIDARTDVYSLGVLLYRMLTGQPPYETQGVDLPEAARIVCEQPPRPLRPAPGSRLSFDHDLAVIVRKTLEKNPAQRYQTVAALDEDLDRYLAGQPILARAPSATYQIRLLVLRHTGPFAAAGLILALVVGFAVFAAFQSRRIAAERDRARREAGTAAGVSQFLVNLFGQAHPNAAMGRDPTARQLLDEGTARIDRELAGQPEVQAQLMQTMGSAYSGLGLYTQAASLLERALEIRRPLSGDEAPETLAVKIELARNLLNQGKLAEAEAMARNAYESRRRTAGEDDQEALVALEVLAWTYDAQGRSGEEEAARRRVLEGRERVLGPESAGTLMARSNLARFLSKARRYPDAEPLLKEALAGQKRVLGEDHPNTLGSMLELADLESRLGRQAEAEVLARDTIDRMRRVLGQDHPMTLSAMNDLGTMLDMAHRYPEAQALFEDTLARRRRILGDDHPDTLTSLDNLANMYSVQGRYAEAGRLQQEALEKSRRLLGARHPNTLSILYNLGCTAALRGDHEEAIDWLTQAVENGWTRGNQIAADEDLKPLRSDPRFRALVSRANAQRPPAPPGATTTAAPGRR